MSGRGGRLQRGWKARLAGAGALVMAVAGLATVSGSVGPASADANGPPAFPTACPVGVAPPPGYPNPPPTAPWTYPVINPQLSSLGHPVLNQSFPNWYAPTPSGALEPITVGHQYGPGRIQYEAPFRAIVADGIIKFAAKPGSPSVVVPHVYGSICGTSEVPQLTGSIPPTAVNMAPTNVYVAGLEAVPVSTSFGTAAHPLTATILSTPAHNGGIDAALSGTVTSTVNTLGLSCGLSLPANLSTLQGEPVTGPPTDGFAEVVASVPVPALPPSRSCPAVVADTFNKLLGLSSTSGGTAVLTTPFCFDFELNGQFTAKASSRCPWPAG